MELRDDSHRGTTTPHLTQKAAFEAVLQDYHLSPEAQKVLDKVPFVLLVGPSSSGRNTIIEKLISTGKYHFIISDTTRPPRYNNGILEEHGREYWFRSENGMLEDLHAGQFLEAEIIHGQQVSGVSIRELSKALKGGKIAITDLDIGGINKIKQAKPDATPLLILPPSFAEWQRRLTGRGTMDPGELRRRLETAARIFTAANEDEQFLLVVNDNIEHATAQIHDIVEDGTVTPGSQVEARQLALKLRDETFDFLKTLYV